MNLRRVIYNYVNPNRELKGKPPVEVAKITMHRYLGGTRLKKSL